MGTEAGKRANGEGQRVITDLLVPVLVLAMGDTARLRTIHPTSKLVQDQLNSLTMPIGTDRR